MKLFCNVSNLWQTETETETETDILRGVTDLTYVGAKQA